MMRDAEEKGTITSEQVNKINEGEDFYFFRNTDNVKDKDLMDKYKAYEVIFRLMPALPESWKLNFTLDKVSFVPKFMIRPLSMLSDIATGFRQNNPEFSAYAMHNLYHLYKFFAQKFGIKVGNASKVIEDVSFNDANSSQLTNLIDSKDETLVALQKVKG